MAEFKTIERYPDYEANRDGVIRRKKTKYILTEIPTQNGSPRVKIGENLEYVSRLIAETFLSKSDMQYVMHRDHDLKNNRADNLVWVRRKHIHRSYYGLGANSPGGNEPAKPVRIIETGEVYPSIKACARAMGGYPSGVRNALNGSCNTYKGFHLESADD